MKRIGDIISGVLIGAAITSLIFTRLSPCWGRVKGDANTDARQGMVTPSPSLDALWAAICEVESGGDPLAYNIPEESAGIAQIRPICVRDCNRIVGEQKWSLYDRWSVEKSKEMWVVYTSHYMVAYGLTTAEDRARIWNGGPKGWKKTSTLGYWGKVQKALERGQ